jgi:hypothetical protein
MKIDITSRTGVFWRRMYSGKKRVGAPVERSRSPAEGAELGRGRTEWDEQMAAMDEPEKNRVKASGSPGAHRGRYESGRP